MNTKEKIQEILVYCLRLHNSLKEKLQKKESSQIEQLIAQTADILQNPEYSLEEQAVAVVNTAFSLQILRKKRRPLFHLYKTFSGENELLREEIALKKAKKILDLKGEECIKTLVTRLRWDGAQQEDPIQHAFFVRRENSILQLIQKKTPCEQ